MKKHLARIILKIGLLCAGLFLFSVTFPRNAMGTDIGLNTLDDASFHSDIMNPMVFGAIGDGKTDDTLAIQKAIDYCVENKIAVLDGLNKTYLVSDKIEVPKELTTYGDKGLCLHGNIIFQNAVLILKENVKNLTAVLNIYNNPDESITVCNIRIDGNLQEQDSITTSLQDGGLHGIRVGFRKDCGNIQIQNCVVQNCYSDGICTRPVNFTRLIIKDCYVEGNGRNGITDNAKSSLVENCYIIKNGVRTLPKSGYHIETDGDAAFGTKILRNCTITDNVSRDIRLTMKRKTYSIESFEIEGCEVGSLTWVNRGNKEGTVFRNISIRNSRFHSLSFKNSVKESTINRFEEFSIVNTTFDKAVSFQASEDYPCGLLKFYSLGLNCPVKVSNVKNVLFDTCVLSGASSPVTIMEGVENVIFTSNYIKTSLELVVDFGQCENLICCNNFSESSGMDTFVYDNVRFPFVENNLYSE